MKISAIKTAAAPYLLYILIAAFLVTAAVSTWVGTRIQKASEADARAALVKKNSEMKLGLENAANALRGCSAAITGINNEAERQIALAKVEKEAFADAANVAIAAKKAAEKQIANERKAWDKARKNEACRLLQDTDIVLTCGVPL